MEEIFSRWAKWASHQTGRGRAFWIAVGVVLVWAVTGPLFGWSDTWQLIINTGTTVVTFLMVFLIQNTQNRDTEAIQIKLDELIRVTKEARNELIDMEDLPESAIEKLRQEFAQQAEQLARTKAGGRPAG